MANYTEDLEGESLVDERIPIIRKQNVEITILKMRLEEAEAKVKELAKEKQELQDNLMILFERKLRIALEHFTVDAENPIGGTLETWSSNYNHWRRVSGLRAPTINELVQAFKEGTDDGGYINEIERRTREEGYRYPPNELDIWEVRLKTECTWEIIMDIARKKIKDE